MLGPQLITLSSAIAAMLPLTYLSMFAPPEHVYREQAVARRILRSGAGVQIAQHSRAPNEFVQCIRKVESKSGYPRPDLSYPTMTEE